MPPGVRPHPFTSTQEGALFGQDNSNSDAPVSSVELLRYTDQQEQAWLEQEIETLQKTRRTLHRFDMFTPEMPHTLLYSYDHNPSTFLDELSKVVQTQRDDPGVHSPDFVEAVGTLLEDLNRLQSHQQARQIRARIGGLDASSSYAYAAWNYKPDSLEAKRRRTVFIQQPAVLSILTLPKDERECTICKQDYSMIDSTNKSKLPTESPVRLACGHIFGSTCINRWIQEKEIGSRRCPLCRADLKLTTMENDTWLLK